MSRKIIGITVGTTLPKPNFSQTDPTKGDYIKNKPTSVSYFENDAGYITNADVQDLVIQVDSTLSQEGMAADAKAVGDAILSHEANANIHVSAEERAILLEAIGNVHEHSNKNVLDQIASTVDIYTDATEPANAEDGSVWINLHSDSGAPAIYVRRNGVWEMSSDGKPQTQADWSENDGTSVAYIRNKPFGYTDDIYANSTLPFTLHSGSIYQGKPDIKNISGQTFGESFKTGDEMTVIWDSVKYNLVAKEVQIVMGTTTIRVLNALGNGRILTDVYSDSIAAEDTGEPFVIFPAFKTIYTRSSLAAHSVIIQNKNNIIKLDPKYLPDEALLSPVQPDWNETDENSYAFIKNKPDLSSIGGNGIYTDTEEPIDAPDGTVWIDMDEGDDGSTILYGNVLPPVSEEDNGKILQVVNGAWTLVTLADSEVKTYVDEYINSALEGSY